MRSIASRAAASDQRGLGLVEILVASAIVAIGLVALASAIPLAAWGIQEGKQVSTATFLANARLEQVKHAVWTRGAPPPECPSRDCLGVSSSSTTPPQSGGVVTFPDEASVAEPYADYSRQVRVTDCAGGGCPDTPSSTELRQVTVTVGFRPLTGVGRATSDRSVTLTTLVTQR